MALLIPVLGALSVMGDEYFRNAYRPLLPDVYHYAYGSEEVLSAIDGNTACVIAETVQAESGITTPPKGWLAALHKRCKTAGALLILDEIQAGFGRTGSLWAFEQQDVVPDILLLGKALGGGMPLGAFISDKPIMQSLTNNPVLGHITTFGGHPVSCAAGEAAFKVLIENKYIDTVSRRQELMLNMLQHPSILDIRSNGLWGSLQFADFDINLKIIKQCLSEGLITDWFLFSSDRLRIAPPLSITDEELMEACSVILQSIQSLA